jgi:polar amino acid transport system substrate-binding protein
MTIKNLFLAAALTALGVTAAMPAKAETLRVGMECTYPPFNYRTPEGQMAGYDVDVAQGVAEIIGVDLEYVCQQWDGMVPSLLANKFDLIVASMSITEERKQKLDFSIPYRVSIGRFLGPKDKGLKLFDDKGNPIPENFKGITIGVERASTYYNWIQAKFPDATIQLYDGAQAMLLDLRNGRVDVAMSNPMKAYLDFLSTDQGAKFDFVSPPIDEQEYFGTGVGIGIGKGQEELVKRIDVALKTLIDNGSLEKYGHKYFPFSISPANYQGVGVE